MEFIFYAMKHWFDYLIKHVITYYSKDPFYLHGLPLIWTWMDYYIN